MPPPDQPRAATAVAPIRVAIAGAGYFARFHYDGWQRIPGVSVVAAADVDATKVAALAAEFSVPQTFTDAAAMLAAVPCDLLDIATPSSTHAALVATGLTHGLTVVCQKPFCTSLDEARATIANAATAPDRLIIHENFRFQPWYRETKRQLDANALGDLYQITFRLRPGDGQGPQAYLARQAYFQAMPRFLIRETAIHFIDTFRYLFGEIDSVAADLRRLNPIIAGEDAALLVFQFRNGARGVFDGNRLADHAADDRRKTMGEMTIEGAKATLRLDGFGRLWLREHAATIEHPLPFAWQDRGFGGDCVHLFQAHVVKHLRFGTALETCGRDYLRNLELEDAVYRSHVQQQTVSL